MCQGLARAPVSKPVAVRSSPARGITVNGLVAPGTKGVASSCRLTIARIAQRESYLVVGSSARVRLGPACWEPPGSSREAVAAAELELEQGRPERATRQHPLDPLTAERDCRGGPHHS